jgi:SAM-dependent methyltransferase
MHCEYCGSDNTSLAYIGVSHKVDMTFGPFDLFRCNHCRSLGTANPPSELRLSGFYRHYERFRPQWYKEGARSGALDAQYGFYAHFLERHFVGRSWLDVGAGHGEVANKLMRYSPNGSAADIGPRPAGLDRILEYSSVDMNQHGWSESIGREFDTVFSVAVWEHVLEPSRFARECLSLVANKGRLILICPDYGSFARKVLGRSWPYFEPGEHITVPTRKGADLCLQRQAELKGIDVDIQVLRLNVRYSLRYLFEVLRLRAVARMLPPSLAAPLPTGMLAAVVTRK